MNPTEKVTEERSHGPLLEKDHAYYASTSVTFSPEETYEFCQSEENVKMVLDDLPGDVDNFLDMTLLSSEQIEAHQYKIVWQNKPESKVSGTLTFLIKKAPANRGTIITSEAEFSKLSFKQEGPSTLMNIFLKRMKSLLETGEIPTIKGQSSGREELKTLH